MLIRGTPPLKPDYGHGMRIVLLAIGCVLTLSGCGGSGDPKDSPTTVVMTAKVSLKDSCPKVEAILPDQSVLATIAEWESAVTALDQIAESGDLETQNAIGPLREAAEVFRQDPAQGQPTVEADQSLIAAIRSLADRCELAGSTAFQ